MDLGNVACLRKEGGAKSQTQLNQMHRNLQAIHDNFTNYSGIVVNIVNIIILPGNFTGF